MKQIFTIFLILTGFSAFVSAQTKKEYGESDPEAKKILDAVSAKVKAYKSMKADFRFTLESASGQTQASKSGNVYMKNTKYKLNLFEPKSGAGAVDQEIYCDGTNVWTYDKSTNEVQVTKFDNSSSTITPQKLFTNFYDKDFLYKLNGTVKFNNKQTSEIELTPFDKTKPFFKVLLYVEKATKQIAGTKILYKDGNKYTLYVNNISPNPAVQDAYFVFDVKKYPGVEVIDLN